MNGEFKEIEELFNKWEREGRKSRTFAALADAYRKRKMYEEALAVLEEGLKIHPDYQVAHFIKAKIHLERNELELARESLKRVLEIDENHLMALRLLAETCEKLGREEESLTFYKKLYDLDPLTSEVEDKIKELEEKLKTQTPQFLEEKMEIKEEIPLTEEKIAEEKEEFLKEETLIGEEEIPLIEEKTLETEELLTPPDEPLLDILEEKEVLETELELPEIPEEAKEILKEIEKETEAVEEEKLEGFKFVEDVLEKKKKEKFISMEEIKEEEEKIKIDEESILKETQIETTDFTEKFETELEGGKETTLVEETFFEEGEEIIKPSETFEIKEIFEEKEEKLSGHPSQFFEELGKEEKIEEKEELIIGGEEVPLSEIFKEPERPSESIEEIVIEKSEEKSFIELIEEKKEEMEPLEEKIEEIIEKKPLEEEKKIEIEEKEEIEIPEEVSELFEDFEEEKKDIETEKEEKPVKEKIDEKKDTEKNFRSFIEWINLLKKQS